MMCLSCFIVIFEIISFLVSAFAANFKLLFGYWGSRVTLNIISRQTLLKIPTKMLIGGIIAGLKEFRLQYKTRMITFF